jgi:hypothetical protein
MGEKRRALTILLLSALPCLFHNLALSKNLSQVVIVRFNSRCAFGVLARFGITKVYQLTEGTQLSGQPR